MNLVLIFEDELVEDGLAVLKGERARAVIESHELVAGLTVRAALFGGKLGSAEVLRSDLDSVELKLEMTERPKRRFPCQLIVAVPRPQTVKKVLQIAATVGVEGVHFVRSANVEKSYLSSKSLEREAVDAELYKGLEQAGDSISPDVQIHERFRPFVEDLLPTILQPGSLRIVAHTRSNSNLQVSSAPRTNHAVIAIGPEAGWNEFEVSSFELAGFDVVSLGKRQLRVDTATTFLLGQLSLLLEL